MPKHQKIFSPALYKGLRGLSNLSGKEAMKKVVNSGAILNALSTIEAPHKAELENLAVELCKEMFPIIDYAKFKIDAKLTTMADVNASLDEAESGQGEHPISDEEKRRLINNITQGASVRATSGYTFYEFYTNYINSINDQLLDKYKDLMRAVFGSYDSDANVATFLQMVQMGNKMGGGSVKVTKGDGLQEAPASYTIRAMAICFPMLVHEIVKGLYEAMSLRGFEGGSKEANQAIIDAVDTLENEVEDLRFGKFIYDAIVDIYVDSMYDDPRIREQLFVDLYKLPKAEFGDFVRVALSMHIIKKYNTLNDGEKKELQQSYKELMAVKGNLDTRWKKWTDWCNGAMAQADRKFKRHDAKQSGISGI